MFARLRPLYVRDGQVLQAIVEERLPAYLVADEKRIYLVVRVDPGNLVRFREALQVLPEP